MHLACLIQLRFRKGHRRYTSSWIPQPPPNSPTLAKSYTMSKTLSFDITNSSC